MFSQIEALCSAGLTEVLARQNVLMTCWWDVLAKLANSWIWSLGNVAC